MIKKILLLLFICEILLFLTGCDDEDMHDVVNIYRADYEFWDYHPDTYIEIKDGYFYYKHEKFTVDENTIGLTIYFSKNVEDAWE